MSDPFILDCSVVMSWFFEDEATPACDRLLDLLNAEGRAIVAMHWPLEVGNALLMGERRKRASPADIAHFLGVLAALSIETDRETGVNAPTTTLALARSHNLSLYDAAYSELAMRRNLSLATLDKNLRTAARKVGIKCLPEKI